MSVNDMLTPFERAEILRSVGVKLKKNYGQVNKLKNPAYNDTKAGMSVNLNSGLVQDFGHPEYNGDVISLVSKIRGGDFTSTINFIEKVIGKSLSKYPTDFSKQSELLYKKPDEEEEKEEPVNFWDRKKWDKMKVCMNVLDKRGIPKEMEYIESYDGINLETLKEMNCGIYGFKDYEFGLSGQTYNNKVYFIFPYESGAMMYRRENGNKEVKHVKGSDVKKSFFGVKKNDKEVSILYLMKSPRECMSMHRYTKGVKGIKVIGIVSGENIKDISQNQKKQLDRYINDNSPLIYIFHDCDNPDSLHNATGFLKVVRSTIKKKSKVYLVNIHKIFDGKFKDFTDIVQFSMKKKSWIEANGFMQIEEECENKLLTEISNLSKIQ